MRRVATKVVRPPADVSCIYVYITYELFRPTFRPSYQYTLIVMIQREYISILDAEWSIIRLSPEMADYRGSRHEGRARLARPIVNAIIYFF